MHYFNRTILAVIALFGLTSAASADALADWNDKAIAFVAAANLVPPESECTLIMVRIAMADAANAIAHRIEQESRDVIVPVPLKDAAIASAAGNVLIGVNPSTADRAKAMLLAYLASLPDVAGKQEGIRLGDVMAQRVLPLCATSAPGGLGGG